MRKGKAVRTSASLDVYAMSNPALCSVILWSFASGYPAEAGPALPLTFAVLPIVMSKRSVGTFDGTNVNTGLLGWISRHPELRVGLPERMEKAADLTRDALLFGLTNQILQIDSLGQVCATRKGLRRSPPYPAADDRGRMLNAAKRLGQWMSASPDTETIFYALGVGL